MKNKRTRIFLGKIILSGGIFIFLAQQVQLSEVLDTLKNISISGIIISSSMIVLSTILTGQRWQYVLKSCDTHVSVNDAIAQVYKGFALTQIMPSNIGGDVYRIFAIKKIVKKYKEAIALVILDRSLGMLSMLICSLIMAPFFIEQLTDTVIGNLILMLILCVFIPVLALCFLYRFWKIPIPFLHKLMHFGLCLIQSQHVFKTLMTALCVSVLYVSSVSVLAYDLNISVNYQVFLLVMPLVILLSIIPISFAGWGVREGLMVFFLEVFGVSSEQALILSVLFGIINLIASAPGAFMFLKTSPFSLQKT